MLDPRVFEAAGAAFAPLRRSIPPEVFAHLEGCVQTILQWQAVATALAERVEPGLVVMAEDSLEHQSAAFIKVFRERGVRTIIVPFTLPSPIEVAEASSPIVVGDPLTSFIATRYPHWVFEYKGAKHLRLGVIEILAREFLGVAPPQPWVYNSGNAAAIALESPAMGSLYTAFGFPPDQLAVVGSSVDDIMSEGLKEKAPWKRLLCEELGADPRKPLLVWAVPPDQFHQRHRSVPEYRSHCEVVDYIAGVLALLSSTYTVVARLHPRTAEAELAPILAARGVLHSRWPTERLVPLSELYVATSSATLRWAIACGVPAINYDLYQYDFMENLNQVRGVVRVTSKRGFTETVHRFTHDSEYRRSLENAQRGAAPEWGVLDGRSGERLRQLCLEHARAAPPR
jgi:RNA-splicing ligase RtcB